MTEKKNDDHSVAGKIADKVLNTDRKTSKEFTYITRYQAILFPLFDTVIVAKNNILEIAKYLEEKARAGDNEKLIKKLKVPVVPDLADELLYSTTQWNKSVGGAHVKRSFDLAETDLTSREDTSDPFKQYEFPDEE